MRKHVPTFVFAGVFCFIVICIIVYPSQAYKAALDGLLLWFNVVCPALLPFFICIEILIGLGLVSFLGSTFKSLMQPFFRIPGEGSFAFFMSIASGYPVGSRITTLLRKDRVCTQVEGQRMLSLCSTSGPLFIIGAVATGIMKSPGLGLLLSVSHYISALTMGFFMRFYGEKGETRRKGFRSNPIREMIAYRERDGRSIGVLIGDAVKNGVNLILIIGGFIILFSVIAEILELSGLLRLISGAVATLIPLPWIKSDTISSLIIGILEVTNGIKQCSALSIPLMYKTCLVSFMIGFGGLSVNAQVLSIISEADLRFGLYLFMKLIQGVFAALYTYLLFGLLGSIQVFKQLQPNVISYTPVESFMLTAQNSVVNFLLVLAFLTITSILTKEKKLKSGL